MKYVLLGDIIGSQNIPPSQLYTELNNLCKKVNQKFNLAVPMFITLGDEWQMVCRSRSQCLEVIEYSQKILGSIKFRAVIGNYNRPTDHVNTLDKFEEYMKNHYSNPLISEDFKKAHDKLEEKINGLVILT